MNEILSIEKAVSHVISIKMKQSILPNKSIKIDTGGSQNMPSTPITTARKESHMNTSRTLRARTKQTKDIMGMIAGNSCNAVSTQSAHLVKSLDTSPREEILKSINYIVTVPVEHVAAMKSTLNLTWNLTREIRRWLKTSKVNLACEGETRDVMKEWIGSGLCCEEIQASVLKGKEDGY